MINLYIYMLINNCTVIIWMSIYIHNYYKQNININIIKNIKL